MKRSIAVFGLLIPLLGLLGADLGVPDKLHIEGGAVIVGQISGATETGVLVETDYAGTLQVDVARISRIVLGIARELPLPASIPVVAAPAPAKTNPPAVPKPAPAVPPPPPRKDLNKWKLEAGINLAGKSGNSDRLDIALAGEAELEREHDRFNIYGKYLYGTNNGVRSADEVILGGRYTSFLFKEVGFFFRQEVEQDDFEGILLRSTTASGVSYRLRKEEDLTIEARTGFSYRFEDYRDGGTQDYPGMDFGFDVNWHFVEWARFKGSFTYLPSLANFNEFILEQDSGFNLPLDDDKIWKLRFGVTSHYNNQPDFGREKLDMRYYARFIATWQ
jgi:putative salt-induced outer membrane protein